MARGAAGGNLPDGETHRTNGVQGSGSEPELVPYHRVADACQEWPNLAEPPARAARDRWAVRKGGGRTATYSAGLAARPPATCGALGDPVRGSLRNRPIESDTGDIVRDVLLQDLWKYLRRWGLCELVEVIPVFVRIGLLDSHEVIEVGSGSPTGASA